MLKKQKKHSRAAVVHLMGDKLKAYKYLSFFPSRNLGPTLRILYAHLKPNLVVVGCNGGLKNAVQVITGLKMINLSLGRIKVESAG